MRVAISKSMDIVIDLLNVIPIIVDMVFYHVVSLFDIIRYFSSYNPFIKVSKIGYSSFILDYSSTSKDIYSCIIENNHGMKL